MIYMCVEVPISYYYLIGTSTHGTKTTNSGRR